MQNRPVLFAASMVVFGCSAASDGRSGASAFVRQASFDPGTCAAADLTKTPFVSGDGSAGAPFAICSVAQLDRVRNNLAASYILLGDIDASTTSAQAGLVFLPIGNCGADQSCGTTDDAVFTGSFDGKGHSIFGLTINRPADFGVGLFGEASGSVVVQNVSLVDAHVTGNSLVGALVGRLEGNVDHSAASGAVTGSLTGDSVGGLVGRVGNIGGPFVTRTISHSSAAVTVTGADDAGGLVGDLQWGAQVIESFSTGSVSGRDQVGGLAGHLYEATILNGYSTANVTGHTCVGGLNGMGDFSTLTDAFATGNITSTSMQSGGLSGCEGNTTLSNSFATGTVAGPSKVGELDGEKWGGTITNTFFYQAAGTTAVMCGYNRPSEPGTGCDDTKLVQGPVAFFYSRQNAPMSAWDTSVWTFSPGDYPRLTSATFVASPGAVDAGIGSDAGTLRTPDAALDAARTSDGSTAEPDARPSDAGSARDAATPVDAGTDAREGGAGGIPVVVGSGGSGGTPGSGGIVSSGGRVSSGGAVSSGGTPQSGGAATEDAGIGDGTGSSAHDDSGCGCRTAATSGPLPARNNWLFAALGIVLAARHRGRRRRTTAG